MAESPRALVVGYDGSVPARSAVRYAAGRLAPGGRLFVVHATGPFAGWLGAAEEMVVNEERAAHGRALLDQLALEAADVLGDVDYELVLVPGSAAEALTRHAAGRLADEIVVGSHSPSGVDVRLGSTAQRVLRTADRPVVVVPAP